MFKLDGFKVWYSDHAETGKTYEDWTKTQDDDVQVVVLYFKDRDGQGRPTRHIEHGNDYYAIDKQGNFSTHFNKIEPVLGKGYIKFGKFMDFNKLLEIQDAALADYGDGWLNINLPNVRKPRHDPHKELGKDG